MIFLRASLIKILSEKQNNVKLTIVGEGNLLKVKTSEKIILEYFQYIKNKLYKDSIFRLLSPLLNIFFCFPNSKKFKTEIQSIMKNKKIDVLESLFLQFIDKQQININF